MQKFQIIYKLIRKQFINISSEFFEIKITSQSFSLRQGLNFAVKVFLHLTSDYVHIMKFNEILNTKATRTFYVFRKNEKLVFNAMKNWKTSDDSNLMFIEWNAV
jgi:hypothetical protein